LKKNILILFLIVIVLSCSKNKQDINSEKLVSDSLSYYMKQSNLNALQQKDKDASTDKAFKLIKTLKNTSQNRDTLFNIAYKYYENKDWVKFQESTKFLLKKSLEKNDTTNIVKSYRYIANYYKKTQVYDSSFSYYQKAEKIYLKLDDKLNLAIILLNKGIVQYAVNDYLGAELSLSKANYIFKKSNDKNKLYGTLNQLGLVCNELKEYDRAADYHKQALATVREFKLQSEEHQEAVCYNNLGYLYIKQKDFAKASQNFELALKDKTILNDDPELYSSLLDNLAYCRLKINDFRNLPQLFFEALEVRKKIDNFTIVVGSYIHLSEYYQKTKNLELALKYSNQALQLAKDSKIPMNLVLALKQASSVDKKNSQKYSEDYVRITDSLQLAERNSTDRFTRLQLETDEIKKVNDFLEEKNRNILNYFMGTVIIGGFLFFMRAQRGRSRELILRQAQQKANEDIYKLIISQQSKLEEGRVYEKTRIAKELHDGVLGRMFGLRLNLDGLNHRTDEEATKERLRCLDELKTIEQDLREISHELSREKYVLINNFLAIVNNLIEEQAKINKASLSAMIGENIDWDLLSNTTKINLYRILQETLQNINKYAKAENIKIEFKKDKKGNLILNIVDDGIGFEVAKKSKGIGLKNIVTRTHESEGIIEIKSAANKGTKITITVPLEHKTIKI